MSDNTDTDLQKTVVALHFDGINAPVVTAKGTGLTGQNIIRLAQEFGIPLHENPALANALSHIPLGEEIPVEIYTVVAEVLAYIYDLEDMQAIESGHQIRRGVTEP